MITHPHEPGVLGLQLGTDPLWLRPRLSRILALYLDERETADQGAASPYLFTGQRPGRPIAAETLTARSRQVGVPNARRARNGALLAMVDQVHGKLMADLLGISDSAAFRWHLASGGDRASYVASRIRLSRPAGPE